MEEQLIRNLPDNWKIYIEGGCEWTLVKNLYQVHSSEKKEFINTNKLVFVFLLQDENEIEIEDRNESDASQILQEKEKNQEILEPWDKKLEEVQYKISLLNEKMSHLCNDRETVRISLEDQTIKFQNGKGKKVSSYEISAK